MGETGRVGFRIDFWIAVADELDLVSEKGSLDISTLNTNFSLLLCLIIFYF